MDDRSTLAPVSNTFELSDQLTERWADLVPLGATFAGISGRDHLPGDFSPEAHAALAELYRSFRTLLLPEIESDDPVQAFGAKVLLGYLDEQIAEYESNKWRRDINHIVSPFHTMRDVFDVMPRTGPRDWDDIASRLEGYPGMLEGYRECLEIGLRAGDTGAVRQVESVMEQATILASEDSRFIGYPKDAGDVGGDAARVGKAVETARRSIGEFADWLKDTYLPAAHPEDPVGREEYLLNVDQFIGLDLDPDETYDWGWTEVHRIMAEMEATAADIDPDLTVKGVIELLETDPDRSAATREEFVGFITDLQQQAIKQLDGEHFDVADELKTVTVNIAPPGGPLGAWYNSPSEDFTRPGSIWYAPGERDRLPYWQEVSTAYHEGFPGHHLQVGTEVLQRDKLSRFHRQVVFYSGSGEGWALYAERLMDELGFFEKPEYRLGLLSSQLFRSTRVVVDIGCHLEKRIPDDAPLHGGRVWDYETAVDYMREIGLQAPDIAVSEVKRYLGWPGQAISYKVGEREILDIRSGEKSAGGFDLKDFHRRVLDIGTVRLDLLREEMS